eukprot:6193415-Pleurochrysis_carterae.AAC.7
MEYSTARVNRGKYEENQTFRFTACTSYDVDHCRGVGCVSTTEAKPSGASCSSAGAASTAVSQFFRNTRHDKGEWETSSLA